MNASLIRVIAGMVACFIGAASADEWKDESGKDKERGEKWSESREDAWKEEPGKYREGRGRDDSWDYPDHEERHSYFRERGYSRLRIPKGHYPPPGDAASGIQINHRDNNLRRADAESCVTMCRPALG